MEINIFSAWCTKFLWSHKQEPLLLFLDGHMTPVLTDGILKAIEVVILIKFDPHIM